MQKFPENQIRASKLLSFALKTKMQNSLENLNNEEKRLSSKTISMFHKKSKFFLSEWQICS